MEKRKISTVSIFVGICATLVFSGVIMSFIGTSNAANLAKHVLIHKDTLTSSADKLCEYKTMQSRDRIGNGENTDDDIVLLQALTSSDSKVDRTECINWSISILKESLGK